jgi:hypothetical protein
MNAIATAARAVMAEVENDDLVLAKQLLRERANGDTCLRDSLLEWAINSAVDAEWRAARAKRWADAHIPVADIQEPAFGGGVRHIHLDADMAVTTLPPMREVVQRVVAEATKRLMDWEMEPGSGKRLGDSTKTEIERYASKLQKQGHTVLNRGNWLMRVAKLLPNRTEAVRSVLREADLRRELKRAGAEV